MSLLLLFMMIVVFQGSCHSEADDWKRHVFGYTGFVGQDTKVYETNSSFSVSIWQQLTKTKQLKFGGDIKLLTIGAEVKALHYQYLDRDTYDPYRPESMWVKHHERWGKEYIINVEGPGKHVVGFFEDPFGNWFLTRHTYIPSSAIIFQDIDLSIQATPDPFLMTRATQYKNQLNVMSYNIWNLNPTDGSFSTKMDLVVKQVHMLDPDIIGFQEVRFSNVEYPRLKKGIQMEDLAKGLPEYQYVFQPAHAEFPLGIERMEYATKEGVSIFSKYPITKTSYINLSRNFSDPEDVHHRVCLGAIIKTPIGNISFFTTHFSLSAGARKRNIVELYEFVAKFPEPSIIAGDFNSEPQTVEFEFLKGRRELGGFKPHFHDAFDWMAKKYDLQNDIKQQLQYGWTYTTLNKEPKKRIDFIFYESPLLVVDYGMGDFYKEQNLYASDHRPIFASFMNLNLTNQS